MREIAQTPRYPKQEEVMPMCKCYDQRAAASLLDVG